MKSIKALALLLLALTVLISFSGLALAEDEAATADAGTEAVTEATGETPAETATEEAVAPEETAATEAAAEETVAATEAEAAEEAVAETEAESAEAEVSAEAVAEASEELAAVETAVASDMTEAEQDAEEGVDTATGECTDEEDPVCGEDGTTYANQCKADEAGATVSYGGQCDPDADAETLDEPAKERDASACQTLLGKSGEDVLKENAEPKKLEAAHLNDGYQAKMTLAEMDAVIEIAEAKSIDASELEKIKAGFEAKIGELKDLVGTPAEYKAKAEEMKKDIRAFREKAHALPGMEGAAEEVRAKIKEKKDALKTELSAEKDAAKAKAQEVALRVFDAHVCLAEEKINKMYNDGLNTEAIDAKLSELKALRPDLEAALNEDNKETVKELHAKVQKLWTELRSAHLAKERVKMHRNAKKQFGQMEDTIAAMEAQGADPAKVDALRTRMDATKDRMAKAEKYLAKGNPEAAKKFLDKAQDQFKGLKQDYQAKIADEKKAGRMAGPQKMGKAEVKEMNDKAEARKAVRESAKIDPANMGNAKPKELKYLRKMQEIDPEKAGITGADREKVENIKQLDLKNPKMLKGEDLEKIKALRDVRPTMLAKEAGAGERPKQPGMGQGQKPAPGAVKERVEAAKEQKTGIQDARKEAVKERVADRKEAAEVRQEGVKEKVAEKREAAKDRIEGVKEKAADNKAPAPASKQAAQPAQKAAAGAGAAGPAKSPSPAQAPAPKQAQSGPAGPGPSGPAPRR